MSIFSFKNVKISGLSVVIPEKEINIYDEAEYYNNSIKKIDRMRKMVGFYKRRVADDTTTASDLAIQSAENLIKEMNIDKSTIDALVYIVQQPDYMAPATSYFIHQKLGLPDRCIATDINQGCAGWVFGLFMVSQMIQSGTVKKVLLVNGDTPSVGIDPADRNNAPIFGDGGCATLLEYSEKEIDSCYNIETRSDGFEAITGPSTGNRFRFNLSKDEDFELINRLRKKFVTSTGSENSFFGAYMDGIAVFDFTMTVVPPNIKKVMEFAGIKEEQVGALCLHQANKQIVETIANAVEFPLEKVPYKAFENYGNNTMCSIPTTISILDKSVDKSKLVCSGFGNGLVCASAVLNLQDTFITELKTFKKPDYIKTREEFINYWIEKMKG